VPIFSPSTVKIRLSFVPVDLATHNESLAPDNVKHRICLFQDVPPALSELAILKRMDVEVRLFQKLTYRLPLFRFITAITVALAVDVQQRNRREYLQTTFHVSPDSSQHSGTYSTFRYPIMYTRLKYHSLCS